MRRLHLAPRTLRWRLTLLYVGLLACLLTAFSLYQYTSLRRSLIEARVASLSADVEFGRALFNRGIGLGTGSGGSAALKLARSVSAASGQTVGVVVYGPDTIQLAAASGSGGTARSDLPHLDSAAIRAGLAGQTTPGMVIDGPGGPFLTVAYPGGTTAHGLPNTAIQVSVPMQPISDVLGNTVKLLIAGSGVALLLALAAGLLLTATALKPLRRLTAAANRLAAGDLRARSSVQPRDDEVGVLAGSFDSMADRIENLFAAQQESEQQVRRFIADASHELRTPITAIKGYIDIMQRGAGREPAALDSILGSMGREADRMRVLVLDLLTLARLDAHKPMERQVMDLRTLAGEVLDEGVPGMPAEVEQRFAPAPVWVNIDRNALHTVLRNLLVNSCKYAPGSPICWEVSAIASQAVIRVHDDGPGVDPGDLPHLFERFYRGEKTRAREEGGSGLGLAIVDGLVRAQGGTVRVDSNGAPGITFIIELPLAAAPAPTEVELPQSGGPST